MTMAVQERQKVFISVSPSTIPTVDEICLKAKKEAGVVRFRNESLHSFITFMGRVIEQVRFSGKPRPLVLPELTVYRSLLGLFIPQEGQNSPTQTYTLLAKRLLLPGEAFWWSYRAEEEQLCVCDGTVIGLSTGHI